MVEQKIVNYHKLMLTKGCMHNLQADSELNLKLINTGLAGAYITPVFDSRDLEATFHRVYMELEGRNLKYELIVAVTSLNEAVIGGQSVRLSSYLMNTQISQEEKRELLTALPHIRAANTDDILLHSLTGRFVYIYVGVYPAPDAFFSLSRIQLELPRYSFLEYFPEIYRGNDFFEKFISIFQTMFLDAERSVENLPLLLDYENTGEEQLRYLAGWLGIEDKERIFTQEQLKYIIRNIDLFQGGKGTRTALEEILCLVCGVRPKIVEYFVWNKLPMSQYRKEQMLSLYGETGNHFCVILDLTKRTSPLPVERAIIEKLIESYSMMGTEYKLVYLQRCNHMDTHCYLGINSCLSTPEAISVGEVLLGSHITVG